MAYEAAAPNASRVWRRHIRKHPLSVTPRVLTLNPCLYDKALDLIAPWRRADYPGRDRAWVQLTATLPWALRETRHGKRPYDLAIIERLLSALDSRGAALDSITEALRAERDRLKALPTKRNGFCVVDSVTGHDKRYRGRKNSPHNK